MTFEKTPTYQSVQIGAWTDHDARHWRILTYDHWAAICTALIAVWLSLAWKSVIRITKPLRIYVTQWLLRGTNGNRDTQDQESQPLLSSNGEETEAENAPAIIKLLETSEGVSDLWSNIFKHIHQRHSQNKIISVLHGLLFSAIFVAWIIIGVYSASIETDSTALWASDHCGVWMFDSDNAGDGAATRADVRDRSKESRAGEYAKSCYQSSENSVLKANNCNFFSQPAIPFTNTTTYKCPFANKTICAPATQAITFDTGLVDAREIGINQRISYKFRRSTTCTPLNTDRPFVESEGRNENETFYYNYGKTGDRGQRRNHTFTSVGNPFNMLARAYNVNAYATSWYPDEDYWIPRSELQPPENSTITILFISALHIFYLDSSSDPIFSADEKYNLENQVTPWWHKSDHKFGVLACIDQHQLCSPDGKSCWSMRETRDNLPPSYWLMKLSLEASNIYDAIAHRLGSALIAQELVSQSTSPALDDHHWMVEAARLFATSLARIQFDAWSIASGEDRDQEGFVEDTPEEAKNKLCGLFKFKSTGYKNLELRFLIPSILATPLLYLLSREINKDQSLKRLYSGWATLKSLHTKLTHVCTRLMVNTQQVEENNSTVGHGTSVERPSRENELSDNVNGGQTRALGSNAAAEERTGSTSEESRPAEQEQTGSTSEESRSAEQERTGSTSEESRPAEQGDDARTNSPTAATSEKTLVLFFLFYLLFIPLMKIRFWLHG